MKLPPIIREAQDWFFNTSERALDQAYQAALKIKEIENENFAGEKINRQVPGLSQTVINYLQSELNNNLQIIRARMIEFKASNLFFSLNILTKKNNNFQEISPRDKQQDILNKLKLIDEVVIRYQTEEKNQNSNTLIEVLNSEADDKKEKKITYRLVSNRKNSAKYESNMSNEKIDKISEKKGVLPRSFISTFKRIQEEMDPNSQETEEDVVKRFRKSRYKTVVSIKLILLPIIVPY